MVRIVDGQTVTQLIDYEDLLPVVADKIKRQHVDAVERPPRSHVPIGFDGSDDPEGIGLVMPAYVHGAEYFVTKIVGMHEENVNRGYPTINATVVLMNARTGRPAGYLAGTAITNARTGCIGGLAAHELTTGTISVAVIGAGPQARAQASAVDTACDIKRINVFSPSDSKLRFAEEMESELGLPVEPATTADDAVRGADLVVTATTATSPVFSGSALRSDAVVVAIGAFEESMRELDTTTFDRAACIFGDVPDEAAEVGDIVRASVGVTDIDPFATVLTTEFDQPDGIIVVESVGSAVFDAVTAVHLFKKAERTDDGNVVEM